METPLLNSREAAAYCKVSVGAVYYATAAGKIRSVVWGNGARNRGWKKTDLDKWVNRRNTETGSR